MNEKNDMKSTLMLVSAMLIFGTIGIFRRYIPLPSAMLACFRGLAGSAFLLVFVKVRGKKIRHGIGPKLTAFLVLNGMLIGLNWMLLFEAYNYTTVAVATLCYYMEPTIVILLSPIFFKEKLTRKKGICALTAIVGMTLVSDIIGSGMPTAGDFKGILLGLGSALLYSSVVIMNKKMPNIDAYEKTIIQLFSAALVMIPYLAFSQDFSVVGQALSPLVLFMLLIVGIIHTGIAYALYFGSVDGMKAQSIAILSYLDPITALILSALLLHESMSVSGMIGAALILGAALVSELR